MEDLIKTLMVAVQTQPMVQTAVLGSLSLAVSGLVGYSLRELPMKILGKLQWLLTVEVTIDDSNWERIEILNKVSEKLLTKSVPWLTKNYTEAAYYTDSEENGYGKNTGSALGYGTTLCYIDNKLFWVEKYKIDTGTTPFDRLTLMPSTREIFRTELDTFQRCDNLLYKKATYLLHGIPGSGKTGIIRAIAKTYSRPAYVINLSGMDDKKLFTTFRKVPKGSIILIEDCDCISATTSREGEANSEKPPLTLAGLLNCLDGIVPLQDMMVFLTTNHLENLDPALYRKARVNRVIELPLISQTVVAEGIKSKYGIDVKLPNKLMKGCEVYEVHRKIELGIIDL